ncbi:mechanosensitive ion channel family protein [Sneathiella marina]|uniref:Mechanosensitive ion channel family protein n=1 Tax=Sneathiella marina TaxID=2950108 RepID=A0ABY4W6E5_9PROT|nr:mechanosensitive ion channel family protein [Sneathiella marina]USG61487.1 mechanosensitive ion channel family protein [Sneathiella marina]
MWGHFFKILSISFMIWSASTVWSAAQTPEETGSLTSESLQKIIDDAASKGLDVVVVSAKKATATTTGPDAADNLQATVGTFRAKLITLIHHFPQLVPDIAETLIDASAAIGGNSLLWTIAVVMVSMGIGLVVVIIYLKWLIGKLSPIFDSLPFERSVDMCLVLVRYAGRVVGIIIFCVVSFTLSSIVLGDTFVEETTIYEWIYSLALAFLMTEIWRIWLCPSWSERRIPDMSDEDSIMLFNWLRAGTMIGLCTVGLTRWIGQLGLNTTSLTLIHIIMVLTFMVFWYVVLFKARNPVSKLISGHQPLSELSFFMRTVARGWHHLIGIYLVFAGLVSVFRLVMGLPDALGLMAALFFTLVACLTVYGIGTVIIDRLLARQQIQFQHDNPDTSRTVTTTILSDDDEPTVFEETKESANPFVTRDLTYVSLARQGLLLVIFGFAGVFLLAQWGIDLFDEESSLVRMWDVVIVIISGYIVFQVAKIAIERKIEDEGVGAEPEPGEEGGAAGATRLATLLPLIRYSVLATIVVMTAMIALSGLGLDVGPLFAGAGIIGMAVGFGAQTLIRDIFSGAFFLFDDAFRKGEYVDVGDVKGTVERITIRSLQLRHHMGPLNTIPYGEIRMLKNFSRDWVMMKLKLRLTYDTDVEKVRKLIKKLGVELQEHPEFGKDFLQPLKSQGVYAMEDSAMIIRVKYMTRPGDQFVIRKHVYARIRELFEQNDIKFAHRQVTVRLADDEYENLNEKQKTQVLGAALGDPEKPPK